MSELKVSVIVEGRGQCPYYSSQVPKLSKYACDSQAYFDNFGTQAVSDQLTAWNGEECVGDDSDSFDA
jgi:hypothetical protein